MTINQILLILPGIDPQSELSSCPPIKIFNTVKFASPHPP